MSDPHAKHSAKHHETAPLHDPVDSWHDHAHDEKPMAVHAEDVDTRSVLFIGIALFIVVVISCVIVYGFYVFRTTQKLSIGEVSSRDTAPAWDTRRARAASFSLRDKGGELKLPTEVEGQTKTIQIRPLSDAMRDVAAEYTSSKSAQGN